LLRFLHNKSQTDLSGIPGFRLPRNPVAEPFENMTLENPPE
jgi:hypothetical protein